MKIPKELVVKDNALNQYTFYKSSVQLKIFAKIICDIRNEPEREVYTIEIKKIFEKFGGSKENYTQLKRVCQSMGQMVDVPQDKGFSLSALFYNINTNEDGLIHFEVNPKLKPYLLNISNNFTSYHLDKISHLKSAYSIRIYELLKQYQKGGWWKVTLVKLKELLKVEKNKSYNRYSNFKQKVILTAQKEIEQKTDIKFQFEEQKTGRKVEVITFYILPNSNIEEIIKDNQLPKSTQKPPKEVIKIDTKATAKNPIIEPETEQKSLPNYTKNQSFEILSKRLQIEDSFIEKIYQEYSEDRILANAKYTLKKFEKGSIKSSVG
jgi:plasmid replication initiation protein